MTAGAISTAAVPSWTMVLRQQFWLLGLWRRWLLVVFGGILAIPIGFLAYQIIADAESLRIVPFLMRFDSDGILICAAIWALAVWEKEPPSERLYYASMPVDRGLHERLRTAAGALWMIGAVGIYLAAMVLGTLAAGLSEEFAMAPVSMWVSYFTAPLTLYLFTAVASLRSERPFMWVVAVWIAVYFVPMVMDAVLGLNGQLVEALRAFMNGPLGPMRALAGGFTGSVGVSWFATMLLWLGLAVAAAYAATIRQQDV